MASQEKFYRGALEVLGKLGSRTAIRNGLNHIKARTSDPRLSELVRSVMGALDSTGTNTTHTPIEEVAACRESAGRLAAYCREKVGAAQ